MIRGVNRNPRRWTDPSERVRVIEGWHPARPDRVGYNLLLDGAWLGTFDSLDDAARAAAPELAPDSPADDHDVVLVPYLDPGARAR